MKKLSSYIICIALSIIALGFSRCSNPTMPDAIANFNKNIQKDDNYLEDLAHLADSCTPKHSENYVFFEKKSEIFYQKGQNNAAKSEFTAAANDYLSALEAEKQSITIKGEANNDDFHCLGQIYESLGDLYGKVNSVKAASYFYNNSLTQYENASRQHEVIDVLLKTGDMYQAGHIPNIALLNYETAEEHKNLTETQLNDILVRKGIALYDISDHKTADSIYGLISHKSLQNIEYHYFAACHFYSHNNFDEALPHLKFCFKNGSQNTKMNAAEMLADVCFNMNDRNNELLYAQYQAKATSAEARLTPTRLELEALYDSFTEKDTDKSQGDAKRLSNIQWIILIVTVIILIGVATAYLISRRKNLESHKLIQDKVKIIDDKEKIINEITQKLEVAKQPAATARSFDEDFKAFAETKIFKEIKDSLEGKTIMTKTVGDYPRLALSKTKIVTLTTKFNECFPNLTHSLIKLHPELTPNDIRYIILAIMGLSGLEIAVLLQLTYSTTNKRSNHIKSIFGTEEALEHFLPDYLRSIKY